MTKQTTIAAVCLATAATFAVTWGQPQPEGTGGDPCPSDIDNDGIVGITDFLQVLADWGPCPSPSITTVALGAGGPPGRASFRAWSDGRLEAWLFGNAHDCWDCSKSDPIQTWLDAGTTPGSVPAVDIDANTGILVIGLADGTSWRTTFAIVAKDIGCPDNNGFSCHFEILPWSQMK